jgi:hypothetical protein
MRPPSPLVLERVPKWEPVFGITAATGKELRCTGS